MTIDTKDLLNSIMESLSRIDHIELESLPDINLYMDQVITFMEKELHPTKRNDSDQDHDQQLRQEPASPATGKEKILQRTYFNTGLYLLF